MGDGPETKFKEDHLVLPVATPLPHHHSHNALGMGKSGYQKHPTGTQIYPPRGHCGSGGVAGAWPLEGQGDHL